MSPRTARIGVRAILAIFVLWPLAQHVLSRTVDVHPWRLYGFGMYSTYYSARPAFTVLRKGDREPLPLEDAFPILAPEAREFSRRRAVLGRFVSEERFARALLAKLPEVEEIRVEVATRRLDPARSAVVETRSGGTYRREAE
jgi:hypothetical protein